MPEYSIIKTTSSVGNGRDGSQALSLRYPNHIIFLHDGYGYRAYDDNAIAFSRAVNISTYRNVHGEVAVKIDETDLRLYYRHQLEALHNNYVIKNGSNVEIHTFLSDNENLNTPPATQNITNTNRQSDNSIKDRTRVTLNDGDETFGVLLIKKGLSVSTEITRGDGSSEIQNTPVTELGKYRVLSESSPLYRAVVGKYVGDVITCNGQQYKIIDVNS